MGRRHAQRWRERRRGRGGTTDAKPIRAARGGARVRPIDAR
eukprot:COSAG02_NODE_34669_length_480_cov_1.078740_1_plen_40_part_10